ILHRRSRPLRAEAKHHQPLAIAKDQRRHRDSGNAALEIDAWAGLAIARRPNVPSPGAADALDEPVGRVDRRRERRLRMWHTDVTTEPREGDRILQRRYGIRRIAEQRPAHTNASQQIGAILEAAAADDAEAV